MKFKNHLENIKVTLMDYPTVKDLKKYIPEFVAITWLKEKEDVEKFMKEKNLTRTDLVKEMFAGRTLPTALETVRLTFFIEGLSLTGVTHLIRHRMFSFSAQSTDPTDYLKDHDILDNNAFIENPELLKRAHKICEDSNKLYEDAIESGMTFYDARQYMPRAKECKYFMSGNIKDWISFIKVRLGKQNQPHEDRILALQLRKEILKIYPFLDIPIEVTEWHYLNSINEKMNLNNFPPTKRHEAELKRMGIDWSKAEFCHKKPKRDYPGMKKFKELEKALI